MNLHSIASSVIAAVNPMVTVSIAVSTGSTTALDGTRSPKYRPPISRSAQVQPLTFRDLQALEGLNLGGEKRAIYLYGHIDGIVRPDRKGGDLITMDDGSVWLVVQVLEDWPDFCKVAVTRQNVPVC